MTLYLGRITNGSNGDAGRHIHFGGRGTILGTFLAAWLLVIVSTGMTVANLLPAIQLTVLGILLIVAIIATNFIMLELKDNGQTTGD